jgi:asparagine synthase (glutamine-hydrolysing)
MFRYVALAWSADSELEKATVEMLSRQITSTALPWIMAVDRPGLRVYCCGMRKGASTVYPLANGSGVVLGTLFRRQGTSNTARLTLSMRETHAIHASAGLTLIEQYWGRYVAFFQSTESGTVKVIKSPTGELDCQSTCIGSVRVFFSRADHCPFLEARSFSPNWSYLAADLAVGMLPETRETGMNEIERVLRGECWSIRQGRVERRQYWHPYRFVNAERIDDPDIAAAELRYTTHECVRAWSSCYGSKLAMLSGGLDSSIVVSVLAAGSLGSDVVCINYRNAHDPVTDERHFAREVANEAGYALIELEQSAAFSLAPLLQMPRLAAPCQPLSELCNASREREISQRYHASAVFTGHGGDQLLFQNGSGYVCADYVATYGLRPKTVSVALDAARMARGALWPTLFQGIVDGFRHDSMGTVMTRYAFSEMLTSEAADEVRKRRLFLPNWFNCSGRVPPGKCWQIIGLSFPNELYGSYAAEDDPEFVFPLLSQPLQELCLRIPTHILTLGGRDRGLARRAFARDVPPSILNRTSKGFVDDYLKELLATNLPVIKSLVCDSTLVKERIVDAAMLEKALRLDHSMGMGNAIEILQLASTEAWLRAWAGSRLRAAA